MDAAAAIKNPSGNEATLIGKQIDHVAIGRCALDPINGRIEYPGMPAKKGPGFARL